MFISGNNDLGEAATSPEAKALLISNLVVSIGGVAFGILTFCLKGSLLKERNQDVEENFAADAADSDDEVFAPISSTSCQKLTEPGRR